VVTIRVLIVDDHSMVRAGLRKFLKRDPELEVVDEAADGTEAIAKARQWRPDVVLMDLLLPGIDGVEAIAAIRREFPETQVLVLTAVFDSALVAQAIRAGAIGYLFKDAHAAQLRAALKAAAVGQVYLAPEASTALLHELRAPHRPEPLTKREMAVLRLLAQGQTNREIAQHLKVSEDTVKTHVRHIMAKLGVQSRTQAIIVAMRLGLLTRDLPP
jgi:two-component system, NarL family, response regulator LiaR